MQPRSRRALADGAERDAPLRLYVDSVRQKLERNAILGGARFGRGEVRADPLVSVSLRSDGSIDDVTIVRSSGRPDMDEAVRRFVHLNARYAAFPPNVAARFDVIEIRRVWAFAEGLKLLEELR
ncbi:TonB family protein [Massilia agri]|uniref:TonB family protein n=2 Tax=Massilia agri TaxID=1886785 RepID=A0ABT2AL25_9BURK|nr:TonB family protein [Massilia agri]